MIIYNTKELDSRYVIDSRVVEITSELPLAEAAERLRNELAKEGEADTSFLNVSSFSYAKGGLRLRVKGEDSFDNATDNVFARVLDEEDYQDLVEESVAAARRRRREFAEYEKFIYGQGTPFSFEAESITPEELLGELKAALGILPTLWNEDRPIAELMELSALGNQLVLDLPGYSVTKYNPAPPLDWIEIFKAMTPYEKAIVTRGTMHPARVMQLAKALKEAKPGSLLTSDMFAALASDTKKKASAVAVEMANGFAEANAGLLSEADEAFKAKFHGHAPRVLAEYMEGKSWAKGSSSFTEKEIEEIAGAFKQPSVARVAKYKNPALLALSDSVDFTRQKDATVQVLGSYLGKNLCAKAFAIGFPAWLNAHADVSAPDLQMILEKMPEIKGKMKESYSPADVLGMIDDERGFADAKRFEERYGFKFSDNEIAIKGRHIECRQGQLRMRMLPANSYRNFVVGYDEYTHCCQRFNNVGETCVYKYVTDPMAACVVIEKGNDIVGQGFVWVDVEKDCFVFDNMEFANDRDTASFSDIIAAYVKALPYSNVQVGTGYNQGMAGWGQPWGFKKAEKIAAKMPTTLDGTHHTTWGDGNCYSDYHTSGGSLAREVKHNGEMLISAKGAVTVKTAPDEPTKWDALMEPGMALMLNCSSMPIDERLDLAREFKENPSPEAQMKVVKFAPLAVAQLDDSCIEAQRYIVKHAPDVLGFIRNPAPETMGAMIEKDPSLLRKMENPPEEAVVSALKRDGMLLSLVQSPTEEMCEAAVEQNGNAVKHVPEELRTERVQIAAATGAPKSVLLYEGACEAALLEAASKSPAVVALVDDAPESVMLAAVSAQPSVVNMIADPPYSVVKAAVEKNGLLIRNFQKEYPELRAVALEENGYAIQCLKNPTAEEAAAALRQNPRALSNMTRASLEKMGVFSRAQVAEAPREAADVELF